MVTDELELADRIEQEWHHNPVSPPPGPRDWLLELVELVKIEQEWHDNPVSPPPGPRDWLLELVELMKEATA
ncbi:MAG: hypothetical protein WBS24_03380 [Terriglobales bacterium]